MAPTPDPFESLSRRERQIMDILYASEEATVEEIRDRLPDPPTKSSVRAHLNLLEKAGHVTHRDDGVRNVYRPVVSRPAVARTALGHLLETFFEDSVEQAVTAMLSARDRDLSDAELDSIQALIDDARRREGGSC